MKKFLKPIICLFVMIIIIIPSSLTVFAKDQRVFDNANILKSSEEKKLEDQINDLRKKYDRDFVIVTTNGLNGKSLEKYAEDFYLGKGFGGDKKTAGFMLLIDMNSRKVDLRAFGAAQSDMTARDNKTGLSNISERLTKKAYFKACSIYLSDMGNVVKGNIKRSKFHQLTPIEMLIAIGVPLLVFVIFVFAVKKKYGTEGKANPYPFKERGKVQLTRSDDIFEREYVTQTQISSNDNNNSGGGGGSSYSSSSSGSSSGGSSSF